MSSYSNRTRLRLSVRTRAPARWPTSGSNRIHAAVRVVIRQRLGCSWEKHDNLSFKKKKGKERERDPLKNGQKETPWVLKTESEACA